MCCLPAPHLAMRLIGLLMVLLTGLAAGCQKHVAELPVAATTAARHRMPIDTQDGASVPLPIKWDELDIGIEAASVYEPWMMKTSIKSLDGQPVRITGYIHAGAVSTGIKEFVLLRNIDCPYGRQGEAHHVMIVELQGNRRIDYTQQPITVEGKFHIRPFQGPDGSTWALYALEGTSVSLADVGVLDGKNTGHNQDDENVQ